MQPIDPVYGTVTLPLISAFAIAGLLWAVV